MHLFAKKRVGRENVLIIKMRRGIAINYILMSAPHRVGLLSTKCAGEWIWKKKIIIIIVSEISKQ